MNRDGDQVDSSGWWQLRLGLDGFEGGGGASLPDGRNKG